MVSCVFSQVIIISSILWILVNCNVCREPKKIGPCRKSVPRYYYNLDTGRCDKFYWGGCQPNGNNFKSAIQCWFRCFLTSQNPCDQSKKIGPCKARFPRYYFDKKTGKCGKFYWGGCLPNKNNFKSLSACRKACPERDIPAVCMEPRKVGPCKAAIPRYYFNKARGKCERFTWGGCLKNGNNFRSLSECSRVCLHGLTSYT